VQHALQHWGVQNKIVDNDSCALLDI